MLLNFGLELFLPPTSAPPNLDLSPLLQLNEVIFRGAQLSVSCEDRVGFPRSDIFWSRGGTNLTSQGMVRLMYNDVVSPDFMHDHVALAGWEDGEFRVNKFWMLRFHYSILLSDGLNFEPSSLCSMHA